MYLTNLTTLMNTGGSAGLAFGAGNSERMRITSGGNLGIGTTLGTFTLNVYNNADVWHARFGSAAGELRIGGETSSGAVIQSFVPGSGTVRNLYIQRDGGNVGIGTTTTSYKLTVNGDLAFNGGLSTRMLVSYTNLTNGEDWANSPISIRERDQVGNTQLADKYAPNLNFHWANRASKSVWMDANGMLNWGEYDASGIPAADGTFKTAILLATSNVGIGTTSPTQRLEVAGIAMAGAGSYRTSIYGDNGGAYLYFGTTANTSVLGTIGAYGAAFNINSINGDTLFLYNSSEKMRITTGGNVGIGTTAPLSLLDVRSGFITAGTNSATAGTTIIAGYYTSGYLTSLGTEFSSGGPVLGYAVSPSTSGTGAFLSSTTITIPRSAYVQDGGTHRWYTGAAQSVAIGSAVTTSEKMRMDTNGNIGIGTSSPSDKLDINGNLYFSKASDPRIYANTGVGLNIDGQALWLNRNTNASIIMATGGGNVGIGTTSPTAKLQVGTQMYGSAPDANYFVVGNENFTGPGPVGGISGYPVTANKSQVTASLFDVIGGWERINASHALLRVSAYDVVNSTPALTVLNNGNVGMGTNSPASRLQLGNLSSTQTSVPETLSLGGTYSNSAGANVKLRVYEDGGGGAIGGMSVSSGQMEVNTWSAGKIAFYRGTTQSAIIDANGNVGIGTSSPGVKLDVIGGVRSFSSAGNYGLITNGSFQAVGDHGGTFMLDLDNTGAADLVNIKKSGTSRFYIKNDGNVGIGTSSPRVLFYIGGISTSDGTTFTRNHSFGVAGKNSWLNEQGGNVGIGTTSPTANLQIGTNSVSVVSDNSVIARIGGSNAGTRVFNLTLANTAAATSNNESALSFIVAGNYSATGIISAVLSNPASAGTDLVFTNYNNSLIERMRIRYDGNVGIGTTSPANKLEVVGSIAYVPSVGNPISISNDATYGTSGTGRYVAVGFGGLANGANKIFAHNTGEDGIYICSATSRNINFRAGGSATDHVTIKSDGNVGIGSTAPAYKLDVNGPIGISGFRFVDQSTNYFRIFEPAGNIAIYLGNAADPSNYFDNTNHVFRNRGGSSVYALINSSGNLGIGTSTVDAPLHIYRASNPWIRLNGGGNFAYIRFDDGTSNGYLFKNTSSDTTNTGDLWTNGNIIINRAGAYLYINGTNSDSEIVWQANGSNRWAAGMNVGDATENFNIYNYTTATTNFTILKANGNVGIGSATPGYKLDVNGGVNLNGILSVSGVAVLNESSNANDIYANIRVIRNMSSTIQDGMYINYNSTGTTGAHLRFFANGTTERMRIDANNGNVGIGTTSPLGKVHIYGFLRVGGAANEQTGTIALGNDANPVGTYGDNGIFRGGIGSIGSGNYTNISSYQGIVFNVQAAGFGSQATRMLIDINGNVGIGTTGPAYKLDVNGTFRTAINNLTIFNDYLYVSPTENNTLNSAYFTNGIADMWINYAGYNNGNTQFRNFNVGNGKNSNIAWFDGTNKRLSINNGQTANYTLDVNGTLNATGTSTLAGVSITGTINSSTTEVVRINNNNGYISFYNTAGTTRTGYLQGNTGNAMLLASENNSIIQFSVGGSEVARISTSGNVGIGTTSPSTKFSIIGTISSVSINAQRQYTYSAIGSTNDDIWFRSSTSFANNGAAASLNLARLTYQSAGTGNDLTDKVGIWLRGFYDNSGGGLPIYLGGYAYSSQIPAVTITGLNSDGGGGNLGIGTTAPLSKLNSYGSGSNLSVFRVDGGNGTLFEVTDQLSGSLFSVNDVSGLPLLEVFSNNRVVAGKYGSNALVVSGSSVGIGTATPAYKLQVNGSFAATTKSFVIKHPDPAKSDKQLVHGVTEGPEHSVFVRGKLLNDNIIVLPDYWQHLVHEESITITLTPNKYYQQLYVKSVTDTTIEVGTETDKPINCYYYVVGERKDIPKLITEI